MKQNKRSTISLTELRTIKTPAATKTWTPTAHIDVVTTIKDVIKSNDWKFRNPKSAFTTSVTPDGSKLFGTTEVLIPDFKEDEEFGMVLGFRNSHDKTIALRFSVGTKVFLCSNLMISADFWIRREHTSKINVRDEVERALGLVPDAAAAFNDHFATMRNIKINHEQGIAFLVEAVRKGALPLVDLMKARDSFTSAFEQDAHKADKLELGSILHGKSMWGAFNSVTEQWKARSFNQLPIKSIQLNNMTRDFITGMAKA